MSERIHHELDSRTFVHECLQPASDRTSATASKICDGEPSMTVCLDACHPTVSQRPPGATIIAVRRPSIAALQSCNLASIRSVSDQYADLSAFQCRFHVLLDRQRRRWLKVDRSAARQAPSSVGRCRARRRHGVPALRRRCEGWQPCASAPAPSSTFESSKVKDEAICACSLSVSDFQNSRAWL